MFIDALSVRKYEETFSGKVAALIGIASGRAGNLRGMEHLTGVLNFLKMHVYPDKLPISGIKEIIDNSGELDTWTKKSINDLALQACIQLLRRIIVIFNGISRPVHPNIFQTFNFPKSLVLYMPWQ